MMITCEMWNKQERGVGSKCGDSGCKNDRSNGTKFSLFWLGVSGDYVNLFPNIWMHLYVDIVLGEWQFEQ